MLKSVGDVIVFCIRVFFYVITFPYRSCVSSVVHLSFLCLGLFVSVRKEEEKRGGERKKDRQKTERQKDRKTERQEEQGGRKKNFGDGAKRQNGDFGRKD